MFFTAINQMTYTRLFTVLICYPIILKTKILLLKCTIFGKNQLIFYLHFFRFSSKNKYRRSYHHSGQSETMPLRLQQ